MGRARRQRAGRRADSELARCGRPASWPPIRREAPLSEPTGRRGAKLAADAPRRVAAETPPARGGEAGPSSRRGAEAEAAPHRPKRGRGEGRPPEALPVRQKVLSRAAGPYLFEAAPTSQRHRARIALLHLENRGVPHQLSNGIESRSGPRRPPPARRGCSRPRRSRRRSGRKVLRRPGQEGGQGGARRPSSRSAFVAPGTSVLGLTREGRLDPPSARPRPQRARLYQGDDRAARRGAPQAEVESGTKAGSEAGPSRSATGAGSTGGSSSAPTRCATSASPRARRARSTWASGCAAWTTAPR
jgi:hypothetical protein